MVNAMKKAQAHVKKSCDKMSSKLQEFKLVVFKQFLVGRLNQSCCLARHTDEMITKLESAGLGYHVKADETTERIGKVYH